MWTDLVTPILELILIVVIPFAARAVLKWMNSKSYLEELYAKEEWALLAVEFVEQIYGKVDGDQKKAKAIQWLSDRLSEKGIKITMEELEGLIEAAYFEMKREWLDFYPPETR